MAIGARISRPRGRGPVSSAPFLFLTVAEVLVREQAVGTIMEPARDRAPAMGTMGTAPATVPGADLAAVLAASTRAGTGLVTATDPMTTKVTHTATVTVMVRPLPFPSTCGRSSGRS